jgi:hypothetical protein
VAGCTCGKKLRAGIAATQLRVGHGRDRVGQGGLWGTAGCISDTAGFVGRPTPAIGHRRRRGAGRVRTALPMGMSRARRGRGRVRGETRDGDWPARRGLDETEGSGRAAEGHHVPVRGCEPVLIVGDQGEIWCPPCDLAGAGAAVSGQGRQSGIAPMRPARRPEGLNRPPRTRDRVGIGASRVGTVGIRASASHRPLMLTNGGRVNRGQTVARGQEAGHSRRTDGVVALAVGRRASWRHGYVWGRPRGVWVRTGYEEVGCGAESGCRRRDPSPACASHLWSGERTLHPTESDQDGPIHTQKPPVTSQHHHESHPPSGRTRV